MQTRLITSYEEATALKDAGWSQEITFGRYYYGERRVPIIESSKSVTYDAAAIDCVAAPRLDQLFAFHWDRETDVAFSEESGRWWAHCWESDEAYTGAGNDRLAALVAMTCNLLNNIERSLE